QAAGLARPHHGRACAGHAARAHPPRPQHAQSHHVSRFLRVGAGARALLSGSVGRALHAHPCRQRSRREAPAGRTSRGPAREGISRVYEPLVVSPASRRCARRLSAVRDPRLPRPVPPPSPPEPSGENEPPGVPGFRTWRGIYLFVFGWFVLVVALLALFSRFFS